MLDVDIVAGGGGGVGALPLGVGAGEDFQAAFGESIGDGASSGGGAGGGLEGSHVVDGLCGAGEAVLGADLGGLGGFGSRVGAGFGVAGGVFGGGTAAKDIASVESAGGAEGHGDEEQGGNAGSETVEAGQRLEGVETVARWTARLRHAANPLKIDGSRSILRFGFVKKLSLAISLFRVGREQAGQGDFVEGDGGLGLEAL